MRGTEVIPLPDFLPRDERSERVAKVDQDLRESEVWPLNVRVDNKRRRSWGATHSEQFCIRNQDAKLCRQLPNSLLRNDRDDEGAKREVRGTCADNVQFEQVPRVAWRLESNDQM